MKKELIVVFSLQGKALAFAQDLAQEQGADLLDLHCTFEPKNFFRYIYFGMKAKFQKDVKLLPYAQKVSDYESVTFVAPIHGGSIASPIVTFIKENQKDLKKMDIILTHVATDDRYESSVKTLEDHLKIQFNHVDSIAI